jgi:hypothetical protein
MKKHRLLQVLRKGEMNCGLFSVQSLLIEELCTWVGIHKPTKQRVHDVPNHTRVHNSRSSTEHSRNFPYLFFLNWTRKIRKKKTPELFSKARRKAFANKISERKRLCVYVCVIWPSGVMPQGESVKVRTNWPVCIENKSISPLGWNMRQRDAKRKWRSGNCEGKAELLLFAADGS